MTYTLPGVISKFNLVTLTVHSPLQIVIVIQKGHGPNVSLTGRVPLARRGWILLASSLKVDS